MATRTGLILASGRGSRMGEIPVPKQLLALPDGTPLVRRVAEELAAECGELICTIRNEKDIPIFEEAFRGIEPKVQLHVKRGGEEYSEISEVAPWIHSENVVQTNGDLIFEKGVLRSFVSRYGDSRHFIMGCEGNPKNRRHRFDIINSRVSVVPAALLPLFGQRTVRARARILFEIIAALLSGRVVGVPTLFNVDTPSDYTAACSALSRGNSV